MRILTVLSGILLSAAGAFCFAFSTQSFSTMAFPVGLAMVLSALMILSAFIFSSQRNKISDTMLVEGIVSGLFGVSVLNNQVADNLIGLFFGAWLIVSGANRLSQSLAVSRYNPKDWFKILPLAAVDALLGTIMTMPTLTKGTPNIMLVALAFIINGLSLLVYAMYIKPPETPQGQIEAQKRFEAKKAAAEEKHAERNRLRALSRDERLAEEKRIKEEQRREALEKKEAKKQLKEQKKEERRSELSRTREMNPEEEEAVQKAAEESGFAKAYDEAIAKEAAEREEAAEVLKNPREIPSLLRAQREERPEQPQPKKLKLAAINLEEIESPSSVGVEFSKVELPKFETAAEGGEAEKRGDIMKWLEKEASMPGEKKAEYVPVSKDDLLADDVKAQTPFKESDKLPQQIVFQWTDEDMVPEIKDEKHTQ